MNTPPKEMQKWTLGIDSDSLINALELMEDLHYEAAVKAERGSLIRSEHLMMGRSYQRTVWAIKYDCNIGRIQS